MWKIGEIIRLLPGRDGQIRTVIVRQLHNKKEVARSVQRVVPVEGTLSRGECRMPTNDQYLDATSEENADHRTLRDDEQSAAVVSDKERQIAI